MEIAAHPAELGFLIAVLLVLVLALGALYVVVRLAVRHGRRDADRTHRIDRA